MQPTILDRIQTPGWLQRSQPSAMESLLTYGSKPGFISFALGLPAVEFFPKTLFQQVVNEVIEGDDLAFQYTPPIEELKLQIVKLMAMRGVSCNERQILITSGAQQGISLLVKLLLENKGKVILEELAYPGVLQAIESLSPEILTVSSDRETGINIDEVEIILKKGIKPAFMYIVTDGGNPLGLNLKREKRQELAAIAERYGMPIIEDDPYGFLYYGESVPPIKHYGNENVFYVGSFSKILAPSLRVGWIVASECFISKLSSIKESYDINTATFAQRAISAYLKKDVFEHHLIHLRDKYKEKRDKLVGALNNYFPQQAHYTIPNNGIFLWVNLPREIDTKILLNYSLKNIGVAYVASEDFSATRQSIITNGMRLNFSHPNMKEIEEGISRLGGLIKNRSGYEHKR